MRFALLVVTQYWFMWVALIGTMIVGTGVRWGWRFYALHWARRHGVDYHVLDLH